MEPTYSKAGYTISSQADMVGLLKTVATICPSCGKGRAVYHIQPFDYKKTCLMCDVVWSEDNY